MQATRSAGFSMLEIVVVLVIIGVLSAMVTGVISQTGFVSEAGEAEQMRMDLRFAQQRAMGSTNDVQVTLRSAGDSYRLPDGMVFINGARTVNLQSDLKTSPNVTFKAQTGMPDGDYTYELGENQIIHINGQTGMIE
jgi:prepilin-type N-terminal cleavage/methylation domain-containing protein